MDAPSDENNGRKSDDVIEVTTPLQQPVDNQDESFLWNTNYQPVSRLINS